ncbi:MAG: type II toxin-antitoxin system HicA family toxin [Armatimonadetes bacterium]|nr:type II toxin-antitoxin system HicA family toxin [Armatimonadota bacterium]
MPKLRSLSGREVRSILEANAFVFVSQSGSHMKMQRKLEAATVTVIVPDHKEMKIGTLTSIIRQSGLSRELFES